MDLKKIALGVALMGATGIAAANQAELVGSSPDGELIPPVEGATVWAGPSGNVLFDNGPLVNGVGTGVGGANESILQSSLGMNTLGAGHQVLNDNRVLDDFTVPAGGGWQIDEFVFFAYQTGSDNTSTMTDVRFRIWDGDPTVPGSSVIFGDLSVNALIDTAWSGIYRVTETTTGGATNRPIMANTAAVGTVLQPGTYWIEWQTDGTLGSGPWAPPITIDGVTETGNGLQSLAGGVPVPLEDSGTLTQQGLPFIIVGTPAGTVAVPTMNTVGIALLVLLVLGVAVVAVRRS